MKLPATLPLLATLVVTAHGATPGDAAYRSNDPQQAVFFDGSGRSDGPVLARPR